MQQDVVHFLYNICHPEEHLGLPVLTWHSTGRSISLSSVQHREKLLFSNARKRWDCLPKQRRKCSVQRTFDRGGRIVEGYCSAFSSLTLNSFGYVLQLWTIQTFPISLSPANALAQSSWTSQSIFKAFHSSKSHSFPLQNPCIHVSVLGKDPKSLHISLYPGGCKCIA